VSQTLTTKQWREATDRYGSWIQGLAKKLAGTLPYHVRANLQEDLVAAGFRGFVQAIQRVDADRAETADAYVRQTIKGAMLDEMRRRDPLSRDQRRRQRELRAVERRLVAQLGRQPTDEEMARASRRSLADYQAEAVETRPQLSSLDANINEGGLTLLDQLPDTRSTTPFDAALLRERRSLVAGALDALPATHRRVIREYYFHGDTLEQIGTRMSVCAARASQIRKEAVQRLRSALAEEAC
jgi:RNA polymerase sigma factor for flagellar operon FliA